MSFIQNNIQYDIAINTTKFPLARQNAMTGYNKIRSWALGVFFITDMDSIINPIYTSYRFICKINNQYEWIDVDKETGDNLLNIYQD